VIFSQNSQQNSIILCEQIIYVLVYLKRDPMKTLSRITLLLLLAITTNLQAAKTFCGELDAWDQFGPFDYRTASKENLEIVESQHFNQNIRNLIRGEDAFLGDDISYTLVRFPNHYPALQAIVKLSLREKDIRPLSAHYSVECFFDRAMRFRPGDGIVRMLYGSYLLKLKGRAEDALVQYQEAVRLQPENANINYNIGLLYLKKKNYEKSVTYAKKAYGLGFPLPGLRNRLKKVGKWDGILEEKVNEEIEESADQDSQG